MKIISKINIRWFVKNNRWLTEHMPTYMQKDFGWGNGYVAVGEEHPWYGKGYDYIECDIHGGLTYAQMNEENEWVVGFDCNHHGDSLENWPEYRVEAEAKRLYEQAMQAIIE